MPNKTRGRKVTTGKFATREELIQNVHFYYYETRQKQSQVAKTCQVSETTVAKILEHKRVKL